MKQQGGVGLAAPQVGLPTNMFVMDYNGREYVCINPSLTPTNDILRPSLEGCLSYPDLRLTVKRSWVINAQWYDEHGVHHEETMDFDVGRIFQHEYDHVRGITIDMKVSKLKLNMAKRKMRKVRS